MSENVSKSDQFDIDYSKELESGFIDTGDWINRAIRDMQSLEKQNKELIERIQEMYNEGFIEEEVLLKYFPDIIDKEHLTKQS